MRKLSEIKGEEAIDVLAEIIMPITEIVKDDEVAKGFETNVAQCVAIALKKHKSEVIDVLAVINGKTKEETLEEIDLMTLPAVLIEILNEPSVQMLFR